MTKIPPQFLFDAGIEQIVSRTEAQRASLPDLGGMLPGESQLEQRLTDILLPRSVEEWLVESFRPEIVHQDILTPYGYEAALASSSAELDNAGREVKGERERETLQRALELLADEVQLRALLSTYRHLLHRA